MWGIIFYKTANDIIKYIPRVKKSFNVQYTVCSKYLQMNLS